MKLYRRPAAPLLEYDVELVREWDLLSFSAWQKLLEMSGAPVVSIAEYHLENTLDHLVATQAGDIIGSLQVVVDSEGRHHLHRLVVRPDYRGKGVAAELTRVADFHYEDVELWAYVADQAADPMTTILDNLLFEEVHNAPAPETFEPSGGLHEGNPGPTCPTGGSRSERAPLDGPHTPTQDRESPPQDDPSSGKRRRRGKRGGRKR